MTTRQRVTLWTAWPWFAIAYLVYWARSGFRPINVNIRGYEGSYYIVDPGRSMDDSFSAMSVGHGVFMFDPLSKEQYRHEQHHVLHDWGKWGLIFPLVYALASVESRVFTGQWYKNNRFEVAARKAAKGTSR
jgi:hypothetical protein